MMLHHRQVINRCFTLLLSTTVQYKLLTSTIQAFSQARMLVVQSHCEWMLPTVVHVLELLHIYYARVV